MDTVGSIIQAISVGVDPLPQLLLKALGQFILDLQAQAQAYETIHESGEWKHISAMVRGLKLSNLSLLGHVHP